MVFYFYFIYNSLKLKLKIRLKYSLNFLNRFRYTVQKNLTNSLSKECTLVSYYAASIRASFAQFFIKTYDLAYSCLGIGIIWQSYVYMAYTQGFYVQKETLDINQLPHCPNDKSGCQ